MFANRNKEEQEEFLVREFLDQQAARVCDLERLSKRIPDHDSRDISGSDVWATIDWQGDSLELAFELTDYFLDLGSHGSVAMRRKEIWNDVCRHIQLKHTDATALRKLHVAVSFTSCLPTRYEVNALADELASFLLSHLPAEGCKAQYYRSRHNLSSGDFEQHPLLRAHFQRVSVRNTNLELIRRRWHCADVSAIGVSAPEIARIIREKTKKFNKYDLAGANECWLLICAAGKSSTNRAGLRGDPLAVEDGEELATAVQQTPFHKVILWDRVDSEYIEIGTTSSP